MVKKAIVVEMTTTGAIIVTSAVGPALGLQLRGLVIHGALDREQVGAAEGTPLGTKLGP